MSRGSVDQEQGLKTADRTCTRRAVRISRTVSGNTAMAVRIVHAWEDYGVPSHCVANLAHEQLLRLPASKVRGVTQCVATMAKCGSQQRLSGREPRCARESSIPLIASSSEQSTSSTNVCNERRTAMLLCCAEGMPAAAGPPAQPFRAVETCPVSPTLCSQLGVGAGSP